LYWNVSLLKNLTSLNSSSSLSFCLRTNQIPVRLVTIPAQNRISGTLQLTLMHKHMTWSYIGAVLGLGCQSRHGLTLMPLWICLSVDRIVSSKLIWHMWSGYMN